MTEARALHTTVEGTFSAMSDLRAELFGVGQVVP